MFRNFLLALSGACWCVCYWPSPLICEACVLHNFAFTALFSRVDISNYRLHIFFEIGRARLFAINWQLDAVKWLR